MFSAVSSHRQGPSRLAYPQRVNAYAEKPQARITTEEFQDWALDRLALLRDIIALQAVGTSGDDLMHGVMAKSERYMRLDAIGSRDTAKSIAVAEQQRLKDHYSHMILRLAVSRSEELRDKFVRAEKVLFRARLQSDDEEDRQAFMERFLSNEQRVSKEEKAAHLKELIACTQVQGNANVADAIQNGSIEFLLIPWNRVTDLVRSRRVWLHKGYAYVPSTLWMSIVANEFGQRLAKETVKASAGIGRLDTEDRLLQFLNDIAHSFNIGAHSHAMREMPLSDKDIITADVIDALVTPHFPLCMRSMATSLQKSHHLKYEGRKELNVFFKSIGVPANESLAYWRRSFSNVSDDKFTKEYKYNFRYDYGLEGNRKGYAPYTCSKLITVPSPGTGQCHGCPYKTLPPASLASLIIEQGVDKDDAHDIVKKASDGNYQLACSQFFSVEHGRYGLDKDALLEGEIVAAPVQYFQASRKLVSNAKPAA